MTFQWDLFSNYNAYYVGLHLKVNLQIKDKSEKRPEADTDIFSWLFSSTQYPNPKDTLFYKITFVVLLWKMAWMSDPL